MSKTDVMKLKDGMELFVMPFPILESDKPVYFKQYRHLFCRDYNKMYIINRGNEFDNSVINYLTDNYWNYRKANDDFPDDYYMSNRSYGYVMYNGELKIVNYGMKLVDKILAQDRIYDDYYYFKKLIIKIEYPGGYANYDNSYFTDKYYNIHSENPNFIFGKIARDTSLHDMIKNNSPSRDQEKMFELFQKLGLIDLRAYLRRHKINKVMNKC